MAHAQLQFAVTSQLRRTIHRQGGRCIWCKTDTCAEKLQRNSAEAEGKRGSGGQHRDAFEGMWAFGSCEMPNPVLLICLEVSGMWSPCGKLPHSSANDCTLCTGDAWSRTPDETGL